MSNFQDIGLTYAKEAIDQVAIRKLCTISVDNKAGEIKFSHVWSLVEKIWYRNHELPSPET